MVPWILLALPVSAAALVDRTHGVHPAVLAKYTPTSGGANPTWKCLDGSKAIAWTAVNDDYCDCPDGSDEPGTGACPNTTFYCKNAGHIGAAIPSTRVNDGKCEPECCDGSDEPSGVCTDTCKAVGEAYRTKQEAERKLRKTGSKIRASYIAFAQKEKKRLEAVVASSEQEVATRQQEVDRLKDIVERTESLSQAALEHKKQSPLYQALLRQNQVLKSLQREHQKHLDREKALGDILDSLRTGYNPNYQDMAVLEAVRGWEHFAGLPHINDVKKDEEAPEGEESSEDPAVEELLEDGEFSADELESEIPNVLSTDYERLLLEHETHVGSPTTESLLFDASAYIPDALLPQFEAVRDGLLGWLKTFGILKGQSADASADASRAKKALSDAEQKLRDSERAKRDATEDLANLFDPEGYGKDGEWKKLDGQCLEKVAGDYTYEVCLFGEAKQKPNNGGSTFSLGTFKSWNEGKGIEVGSPEYYSKQFYTAGTKCWNGPFRSVVLVLSCGTENVLHSVQELEKCEYQLTGTSPALCLPLDAPESKREEL